MEPTNAQNSTVQNQPVTSKTDAIISDMRINPEWMITLALAFFLGILGVHRFYNGKIGTGILMILTFGGLGIWVTIDLIMILFGKFTKKDGALVSVRIPS
jgi:TM2 domain-containing membrane protein YozV